MKSARLVALLLGVITLGIAAWTLAYGGSSVLTGGDASFYHGTALELLHHGRYSQSPSELWGMTIWRPPGYSLWLAGVYALGGPHPISARIAQVLLHGLASWWLYSLMGRLTQDRRAAAVASVAYLLYLPALQTTRMHASEALSATLAIATLWAAFRARERGTVASWALAGLIAGAGMLTRPQSALLLVVPLGLLANLPGKPSLRGRALASCLLAAGLVVGPWLGYTTLLVGRPSLGLSGCAEWISAQHYAGHFTYRWTPSDWASLTEDWETRIRQGVEQADPHSPLPPQLQAELYADRTWKAEAHQIMQHVSPLTLLRHFPNRLFALWGPAAPGLLARVQWLLYTLLIACGMWLSRARWHAWWPLWLPAVLLCIAHLGLVIEPRYTFPLRPLLLGYLGVTVAWFYQRVECRFVAPAPQIAESV